MIILNDPALEERERLYFADVVRTLRRSPMDPADHAEVKQALKDYCEAAETVPVPGFDMGTWVSECQTRFCIAGYAQVLREHRLPPGAGRPKYLDEDAFRWAVRVAELATDEPEGPVDTCVYRYLFCDDPDLQDVHQSTELERKVYLCRGVRVANYFNQMQDSEESS